ncbi:hypothetical protein NE848_11050 [Gramella jeungdoensis]|uniref:Uncharacterized protein n=1 Tax=Gramella jeungdoensis TaxID=708091 RepID=A0ABT0Z2F9_9FLAO|nr:hypothetical protein [Gramella jeungdoensis]MCM8569918.1 hypothetical protein [Gramella jeungdoensis]
MNNYIKTLFASLLTVLVLSGPSAQSKSSIGTIEKLPEERIYVHLNNTLAFSGQYLYFKIYLLNHSTKRLSDISKIAYLNILNDQNEVVFQETLDIKNGEGYGDYFIPVDFASGNYKIVAYTDWMKNNHRNKYFEQDLFIINPYTSDQAKIRKDSISYMPVSAFRNNVSQNLKLKKLYKNRESVSIDFGSVPKGNYSVSVRKIDSLPHPKHKTVQDIDFGNSANISSEENFKLPEARGKLITGKISTRLDLSLNTLKLALSIPGKDYFLRIIHPDVDGNFYFSVDENFEAKKATLQVLDYDNESFEIEIEEQQLPDTTGLTFQDYGIDKTAEKIILDHSIYNQIENAYFSLKPDTVMVKNHSNIFEGVDRLEYDLDDYRRFKTIQETFIEVVAEVQIRKRDDSYEFRVLKLPPATTYKSDPLILVDGIILKDKKNFVEYYDSRRIDKISIIRNSYYLGSAFFSSVILIETFDAHFAKNHHDSSLKEIEITSGNVRKNYYKQRYPDKSRVNLPDFRTQLLWKPDFNISEGQTLEFFTSDVDGFFEFFIQGFSETGQAISIQQIFQVN